VSCGSYHFSKPKQLSHWMALTVFHRPVLGNHCIMESFRTYPASSMSRIIPRISYEREALASFRVLKLSD
jgi:hypothetical protein